jgi:hypothetical protein
MAVAGLLAGGVWYLWKDSKPGPTGPGGQASAGEVAPADLAGLGYLPDDTNAVFAVHAAQLMESIRKSGDPSGARLLDDMMLSRFGQATGLSADAIEYVVVGLQLKDLLLRPVVVVRTRQPYDGDQLRGRLEVSGTLHRGGKLLYRVKPQGVTIGMVLWCPNDRDLIAALLPEQFDTLPATPEAGIGRLSPALQEIIRTRLPGGTTVWGAAHSDDWNQTAVRLLLPTVAAGLVPDDWSSLRSIAFALRLENDVIANLWVRSASPEASAKLAERFRARAEGTSFAVRQVPQADDWLWLQAEAKPDPLAEFLRKQLQKK